MWEIHYSQEAATYLEDNASLIADLFSAMESLAESEGIPVAGSYQEAQGFYLLEHSKPSYSIAPYREATARTNSCHQA